MSFATDRDLVLTDPSLFRDISWVGKRMGSSVGNIREGVLTIVSGSFSELGVTNRNLISADGILLEVVEVVSPTSARVSYIRSEDQNDPVDPAPSLDSKIKITTFQPFLDIVHRQVLAMVGIDIDTPEGLSPESVTNPGAIRILETLGALHLIYASAGAPGRGGETFLERSTLYQKRFAMQRGQVTVLIDLDGDGIAETRRHPNTFILRGRND